MQYNMEANKKFIVNKKPKIEHGDLNKLNKEELIAKIIQLEAHNSQLKNIIEKTNDISKAKNTKKRKFDFSKMQKRHVLLKFLYMGWDYQGFAHQEDTASTIEYHLFNALKKTCLIENRETSNYNRCGRTDKEVSAFCQVISIDLRSKFTEEEQTKEENNNNEIDYCNMLNRVLPNNIKCVAWMPLNSKLYSARFDCVERTYKYFFPLGDLDIEAMKEGCRHLIGTHDFRNLCKMDVGNGVTNFIRNIKTAEINLCHSQLYKDSGYSMFYLKITSRGFLWHQIRCIMSVLLLIGEKKEIPSVITELLNVSKNPCKPLYSLASGIPLNLYKCEFRNISSSEIKTDSITDCENFGVTKHTTEWIIKKENLSRLIEDLQTEWSLFSIKKTMIREMLHDLQELFTEKFGDNRMKYQTKNLLQGVRQKQYQNLLDRKRCESLENRLSHYIKKQRLMDVDTTVHQN